MRVAVVSSNEYIHCVCIHALKGSIYSIMYIPGRYFGLKYMPHPVYVTNNYTHTDFVSSKNASSKISVRDQGTSCSDK